MKTRLLRGVWTLVALGSCALPAGAVEKRLDATSGSPGSKQAQAGTTACPADDRVGGAGLRAFIDPQTGQLRQPTPEELATWTKAAREELSRAVESLQPTVLPDGTLALDLQGLFMQDLVVTRRPDGSLSTQCVPDSEREVAFAAPPQTTPKPALEDR
jgi:hypothetical protein